MSDIALSIQGLKVNYGAVHAVKGISMDVPLGSIVALLGANGAGKTSTLRSISGLTQPAEGKIVLNGVDISGMPSEKIAKLGLAQSPEGRQVFGDLTVEENLQIGAFTVKNKKEIADNFQRCYRYFPRLQERKKQMSYTLSGGELQMLAIARALMSSPKVLLLDEPSLGLAPLVVQDIFNIVSEIQKEGTTVLIVEQNALQTLKIANYGYVLDVGNISVSGKAEDLMQDKRLIDAYLGTN